MTASSVARAGRAAAPGPRGRRWTVLALLAVAQLMLILDVTVVNVALPDIGVALRLSRDGLPWVMTAYTVCFGGLMLLGGRLADRFGPRRLTLTGLAVFTGASLLSGLAADPAWLLAGRALQGTGAALLSPAALATVLTMFTGADRTRALGVWSGLAGLGSALGVILGGVLTTEAGWRWIFTVNVPIGIALLIAVPLVAPSGRAAHDQGARPLDVPGALLVTGGTAAAVYGLVNAGSHGWAAASTLTALALAVAGWTAFAWVERRSASPLLAVGLLLRRPAAAGGFLMLVSTGLLVGGFFLTSFLLQHANGYSALHVGLVVHPGGRRHRRGRAHRRPPADARSRAGGRGGGPGTVRGRLRHRGAVAGTGAGGDRAERRRVRHRLLLCHRVHRVADRRAVRRVRAAQRAGEHVPRARRRGRGRGGVHHRGRRPGRGAPRRHRLPHGADRGAAGALAAAVIAAFLVPPVRRRQEDGMPMH